MGGAGIGDKDLRSRGFWYGCDQDSLGIAPSLDAVLLGDLGQRFVTRKKVQAQLAGALARLSIHVLGILHRALRAHRLNRNWVTPKSLVRAIKLWYLMPVLLEAPDGRIKR